MPIRGQARKRCLQAKLGVSCGGRRAVAVVADDEVWAAAQLLAQLARDVHRELLQVRVHLKPGTTDICEHI